MCCCEASDWHAERRTRNVREADLVAEFHAGWVAAVLAADAHLDSRPGFVSLFCCDLHELADAGLVDRGERIGFDYLVLLICADERTRVVAAHAKACLSEVVRAKAEELRRLCNLVGREGAARDLDHSADHIVELDLFLGHDLFCDAMNDCDLQIELFLESDKRNHDFWLDLDAHFLDLCCSFKDCASLHLGDLRIDDAEAAAAEAEHRIEFMELFDAGLYFLYWH